MKYILSILVFCISGYVVVNTFDDKTIDAQQDSLNNIIIAPKLYCQLGVNNIEISAINTSNNQYKVTLNQILAKLYQDNDNVLAELIAPSGIFDIKSKILTINEGLLIQSNKFNIKSESCIIHIDDNLVVFYKPKVEIL